MANIKSAKKRVKVNATKTMENQIVKSNLKTTLKNFDAVLEGADKGAMTVAFKNTEIGRAHVWTPVT